ncbi:MAG: winged helix-turn-helix domain-containing protein [Saprospiraceae bacterium]
MEIKLSLSQARSFIVSRQLLLSKSDFIGKNGTLNVIEHLGYIQIDTISVVERAHHHILKTRIPNYVGAMLENLEQERKIFEYWSHAASYLPMKNYRYSLPFMEKIKAGFGHWRKRDEKWMKWAYDKIKAEGPSRSIDFKKDKSLSYDHAWGGHPINQALRQLFMEGTLMVSGRQSFQKIFDLTERVLPTDVNTTLPSQQEYYKHLILRDLHANGIMRPKEIGHLITIPRKQLDVLIQELIEDKILVNIKLSKADSDDYVAIKRDIEQFEKSRKRKQLKILSPFDNLIIQRKRMQDLFDFDYTLECYVTEAKRKVGYFSLPLLFGTQFVGQIDLKADRKVSVLRVKNLVWENDVNKSQVLPVLKKALSDFQQFNNSLFIEDSKKLLT